VGDAVTAPGDGQPGAGDGRDLTALLDRVVAARLREPHDREDIVQEALVRTLAARDRLTDDAVAPYAVTVARNLVASHSARADLERRHRHRLIDLTEVRRPDDAVLRAEEEAAVREAVRGLRPAEQDVLVAHAVEGMDLSSLAARDGGTAGGVAARLARARARARVDYLLALRRAEPPTPECRPVLLAVSAADRRRQEALDAAGHLLDCDTCADLLEPLVRRRSALAGLVPLPLLVPLGRLREAARGHAPAVSVGLVAAVAAVAGGAALLLAGSAKPPPPAPIASTKPVAAGPPPSRPAAPAVDATPTPLGTVLFDQGRAALTPAGRQVVADIVARAAASRPASLTVTGYTDVTGTPAENDRLARDRAEVVAAALRSALGAGTPVRTVAAAAAGAIADNGTEAGRRLNRRAVVTAP